MLMMVDEPIDIGLVEVHDYDAAVVADDNVPRRLVRIQDLGIPPYGDIGLEQVLEYEEADSSGGRRDSRTRSCIAALSILSSIVSPSISWRRNIRTQR
jgi:hypothetical protein